ncbi:Nitroreductase [Thalassobacillus cyri]|uniref:Nitroreductase n=1 Tax=Thalassobacillus cyri TaxID=571932 RepID=A0A1H4B407_9BACI|nr:nitroreductase [Thalassobacillus cyri]SEA42839.1 Nitroreductase [Thalassobacillus cyri]
MDVFEAVTKRRSIHDFKQEPVDSGILKEIFAAAAWAPTHRMIEPWEIEVIQKEAASSFADLIIDSYLRMGYAEGYEEKKKCKLMEGIKQHILSIPHHALIYMEKDKDLRLYEEDYAAVCAFIQNVQLLAWRYGVGVLWTSNPYIYDAGFASSWGIDPKKHKIVAVLQMGYPNKIPEPKNRTPITNKLKFMNNPIK